jgi:hypothetical protein
MSMTVRWNGAKAKAAVVEGGKEGIRDATELVFDATQLEVPTDTGALRASGRVDVDGLHGEVRYGEGASSGYAAIIHEKLEIHHDRGSAKYLENPTAASARRAFAAIATGIRRKL